MVIILVPFLLVFAGLLLFFALTKRWVPLLMLLAIPATITGLFLGQALLGSSMLLRHDFSNDGVLQLNYQKNSSLSERWAGIGDLTYHFRKGIITREGILIRSLNDRQDTAPLIETNSQTTVIIRDNQSNQRWLFSDNGSVQQLPAR